MSALKWNGAPEAYALVRQHRWCGGGDLSRGA